MFFSVRDIKIHTNLMELGYLIVACTLTISPNKINTHSLIDPSATGITFVN